MSEEPNPSPSPENPQDVAESGAGRASRPKKKAASKQGPAKPDPKGNDPHPGKPEDVAGPEAASGSVDRAGDDAPKGDSGKDGLAASKGRRRRSRGGRDGSAPRPSASSHDPALLAKQAWKIYLGEINEEGVTLIDDKAARQLAQRSFELASIFLDEQVRRAGN